MVEPTKEAHAETAEATKEEAGDKKLYLDEVTGEMVSKK
jgi:hypothetical protein